MARRASASKSAKTEFPDGPKFDKVLEEAAQIRRARYYRDVTASAEEVKRQVEEDGRDEYDVIYELADSAVTYTADAWNIAMESDNSDAVYDDAEGISADNTNAAITQVAYWAYVRDVSEALQRLQNPRGRGRSSRSRRR